MVDEALSPQILTRARAGFLARDATNAALRTFQSTLFPFAQTPSDPRSVVVHLVGNIGDIVVATPALIALRKRFPAARLTLVTSAGRRGLIGAVDVLGGASFLDEIIEYPLDETRSLDGLVRLLRQARSLHPDLIVMLPPAMVRARTLARNMVFARLTGARSVVGLELSTFDAFLADQARYQKIWEHEVTRYLRLLRPLGVPPQPVEFLLPPPEPRDLDVIAELDGRGPIVAFCPGGKQEGHLWPVDRFGAVAARIREQTGHEVIAIGARGEAPTCDTLLGLAGGGINFAGKLSVRGTAALLRRVDLLVTNDTGPMHLAAAVGTPVVAIFASRDFAGRWYPYRVPSEVLRARDVCAKCLFATHRTDHCVREIRVEDVWAACQRLLDTRGSRSAQSDRREAR
jgi:ADP-heptose:LPS heptosyltransferase